MTLRSLISLFAAVLATSCAQSRSAPSSQPHLQAQSVGLRLQAGFDRRHPRLFENWGAIADLLALAGYDPHAFSSSSWHSTDGTRIILWNYGESRGVVVDVNQPLTVCAKGPGEYVDQEGRVFARGLVERNGIMFHGSVSIFAPNFTPDATGTYFAAGGASYDYTNRTHSNWPVQLSTVVEPTIPLDKMEMEADPVGLVVTTDRIYLFLHFHSPVSGWPASRKFLCRIYERSGATVRLLRDINITSVGEPTWRVAFEDFDPITGLALFAAENDLLSSPVWYLYEVERGRTERLGVLHGNYARFLDPRVFDRAVADLMQQGTGANQSERCYKGNTEETNGRSYRSARGSSWRTWEPAGPVSGHSQYGGTNQ